MTHSEVLLHSTGNYIHHPVINYNRKEYTYIYIYTHTPESLCSTS